MQPFKRPNKPGNFDFSVKDDIIRVKNLIAAGKIKNPTDENKKKIKAFVEKWKDYKDKFSEAQSGKCGYCEMMVTGGQHGDVEHFHPKAEVWKLSDDKEEWGKEKPWSSSVEGRKREVLCDQGYWWLAYEWGNYLLSCLVCNEYWKLSYFPVKQKKRSIPPSKKKKEIPLLLNPFDNAESPVKHLKFNDLGQIEAVNKSEFGLETIRTCGLDRESLRRSRSEKGKRVYKLIYDLNNTQDKDKINIILKDIIELGNNTYVHSGMVRIIFEQQTGMTWDELEKLTS